MLDAVVEVLVMALLAIPGILIRWTLHLGRIPFKKLAEDDVWYNATYTILLIIGLVVFRQYVLKV
ncbi:hypothetical protein SAMN04515668_4414 [Hymenobacter arizonensis]|uniref:Uncharacterized protein n=1 Tax=Hymenobacter arizonensis TaxID=1227077 RepID=A0A1I6BEJ6_HYMAR|nr:hypothetical protein SAMN04515668_4414 [Hymenobacter arizonensis]